MIGLGLYLFDDFSFLTTDDLNDMPMLDKCIPLIMSYCNDKLPTNQSTMSVIVKTIRNKRDIDNKFIFSRVKPRFLRLLSLVIYMKQLAESNSANKKANHFYQ